MTSPSGREDELTAALHGPRRAYWAAIALSLVLGVLVLAPSAYMFEVYGRVVNSRSVSTLAWLLVAAVGIYAVMELLELVRLRILRGAAEQVRRRLARRVFEATFSARLKQQAGGASQAPADLKTVCDFIASPAVTGIMDLPASMLMLALLYAMNVWVGALATVLLAVLVVIGLVQERVSARPFGEAQRAAAEAQLRAAEILRNAQVVESMAMGAALHKLFAARQGSYMLRLGQASERAGSATTATRAVSLLMGSLLLGLAVWMSLRGELAGGAGMAIVASILGGRVLAPVAQLLGQWRQIGAARVARRRLTELLDTVPAEAPGLELPPPGQHLVADGVAAQVPGSNQAVLKGVKLACRAGEMVAVIGPSGCGKSTLARVLVGLWPSQGGKVRLDGADVYEWHKSQLGRSVGYLPQTVELFDGSVAENIARFDRIDETKLQQAIEDAGIGPLIDTLPQGLDTRIGDGGVQLSGGERQRVGLARAAYGEVRLVVLDEPNASLDEAGDRALERLIGILKSRGVIVVVITQRAQVLALADHILLMKDGTTLRFGPRDEVLAALRQPPPRAVPASAAPMAPAVPHAVPQTGAAA
jgi:ATP-binding cassette subfamily C exporter for protease/lipase